MNKNGGRLIMVKIINKFWTEQSESIAAGAFGVTILLIVVTFRYINYFL